MSEKPSDLYQGLELAPPTEGIGSRQPHIGSCAGFEKICTGCDDQLCLMFQHHRSSIPAIWAARQCGLIAEPATLLRLDAHLDLGDDRCHLEYELADKGFDSNRLSSVDEVIALANRLGPDNGGWLSVICEFGWVDRAFTLLHRDSEGPSSYKCKCHSHLSLEKFRDTEASLPDYTNSDCLWVDIDLDFCTNNASETIGQTTPWSRAEIDACFERQISGDGQTLRGWLGKHLRHAKLVTIATEPTFSGGFSGVSHILRELHRAFRDFGGWFGFENREAKWLDGTSQ